MYNVYSIVGLAQQMIGVGFIVSTYVAHTPSLARINTHTYQMDRLWLPSCPRHQHGAMALSTRFPSPSRVHAVHRHVLAP